MSKETILQHWIYLQEVVIETVDRCNTLPNTPADSIILTQTLYLTHTHTGCRTFWSTFLHSHLRIWKWSPLFHLSFPAIEVREALSNGKLRLAIDPTDPSMHHNTSFTGQASVCISFFLDCVSPNIMFIKMNAPHPNYSNSF